MSDKSGGFFSSVGRFFSGVSASKNDDADKPATASSARSGERNLSSLSSRSPSTAPPAALLKDIISNDNQRDSNEVVVDTAQSFRSGSGLRYLSTSALDSRTSDPTDGLRVDVETEDIFAPSAPTSRKRQLTELDRQSLPQTFRSDSVKRSRFLNRSLLEPTLKGTIGDRRLDMSWCGELTSNHSPASSITNFSLLSRRSGATTNGSLSTRTQEIFKRLEGTNTPAKEVQRMSMLRAGLSRPERWSLNESRDLDVSSIGTPPPPLKKAGDAIPSRIQLVSKSMGVSARRNPYWTDLTRKRNSSRNADNGSSETSSLRSLNGTLASAELSSVFSLEPPAVKKTASSSSTASTATMNSSNIKKSHAPILKGPDGKSIGRNTFKLTDDIEEEDEESQKLPPLPETTVSNPKPLTLAPGSLLKQGFLNNLAFTFSAPVEITQAVAKSKTVVSPVRSSESKELDSDSSAEEVGRETSESSSSESDSEESEAEEVVDEVKESRPQTSADTVSTVSNPSSQSSKDSSPKTEKAIEIITPLVAAPVKPTTSALANWVCGECCCSWDQSISVCGACQTPRAGSGASIAQKPAEKQLVSNLNTFAPAQSSNFKFGFGVGAATVPVMTSSSAAVGSTTSITTGNSIQPSLGSFANSINAPANPSTAVATSTSESSTKERVDWECPSCWAQNKSTDSKCVCCQHEMYPSTESSSNVFGSKAFKPTTGTSFQFGVGASSSSKTPLFGFGASKPTEPIPAASSTAPASGGALGKPVAEASASIPVAASKEQSPAKPTGSLFGNLMKPDLKASAPAPAATVVSTPSSMSSLFGNNTNLFGAVKTDATKVDSSATKLFGTLNKETLSTTTPSTSATTSLPPITGSLFGSSALNTPFGGTSIFGAPKTSSDIPKPTTITSFGSATNTSSNEATKNSTFGNIVASSAPVSLQSAPPSTTNIFASTQLSSASPFSVKATDSTTPSIFGKPIQFSGEVGTTTTDGGVSAKRGMFSSETPKLSFGSDLKNEPHKSGGFGGSASSTSSATSGGLFGNSTAAPLFGGSSNSATAFAPSSSAAPPTFGSSSTVPFGTSTTNTGFGSFGSTATQPGMSTSSSTNSLFGQGSADSSNPFATTAGNNGFNFGAPGSTVPTGSSGVFQFGGAAPTAPAPSAGLGSSFQFGNLSANPSQAPGAVDNAFSYQAPSGGNARKMAMARRRNIRK